MGRQPGASTLSEDDRRVLAVWAADCAERTLPLFEAQAPNDTRPRDAIDGLRAFARGELRIGKVRALAARAHAAAREIGDPAAVAAARLVVEEAARRVTDAPGEPETNRWVWRAKLLAGTTAMEVAASMLEAAGTSASRRGHPLERLFRDARCGSLQPATSDVCADWLGIATLGGDPDSDGVAPRW